MATLGFFEKGGGWIIGQFLLIALYIFVPFSHPLPVYSFIRWIGFASMIYGAIMALPAFFKLGRDLTPFPKPKLHSHPVQTGSYAWVRHPFYSGLSALAIGYSLWQGSWERFALAIMLFIYLDRKSAAEEKWLMKTFPEYAAYRSKVKKMIPFLY